MMKRICLGFLALFAFSAFTLQTVHAAEKPASSKDGKVTDPVAEAKNDALNKKYASVMANLDTKEVQHFAVVVVNYNLISTVKAVQDDIQGAVDGCAKNNKQMAETVNSRFGKWKDAVKGPMAEAQANVNNMVLAQSYLSQSEFSNLFGLIEDVRSYNSSRFEKTPVTTPEACEFMLSKMDETQDHMIGMLKATLVSYPSAREKAQE
ncbi:MAG: hypothetical protein H6858_06605 [Rhodospirillales bacterium]|nr:hypothetical protein [Alphaproteobacteria bacterium]MCB9977249.1 hypothetical protein [Rhodospirillales bacterium]